MKIDGVTFQRIDSKSHYVFLHGKHIGSVKRIPVTVERKVPGRRIVSSRWQSDRWVPFKIDGRAISSYRLFGETRMEAARWLIP